MFYKISNPSNLKEIGKYPQTVPLCAFHKKAKRTDYIGSASDSEKITISPRLYDFFKPYLPRHEVKDIEYSNDVYRFDRKNLEYVVKENMKQEFYPYKILHISYPDDNVINYSKSSFYSYKKSGEFIDYDEDTSLNSKMLSYYKELSEKNGEMIRVFKKEIIDNNLPIKSKNDFIKLFEDFRSLKKGKAWNEWGDIPEIGVKKIVFNSNCKDFFRLFEKGTDYSGYYVSEQLKNEIEEHGFTGMTFKPLDEINPHVEIEIL